MRRRLRGPEAESVVMLRSQYHRLEARALCGACPLPRVECGGVENGWRLLPVSPLAIRERVHAEVEEDRQLVAMPLQLAGRWHRSIHRRQCHSRFPRQCASGERQRAEAEECPAVD